MTREKMIETADLICENTFIFNHKWDMEMCKTPVKFDKDIIWNKNPFGDPEWTYMLNRHKYWTFLAKAYILTENKKYLETFINQVNSWIDTVDIENSEYKYCARTIEMGIRCVNWIRTLEIFERKYKFEDEFKNKIYFCLKKQADILLNRYDEFRTLSNWGVLQNTGLIIFSFYFDLLSEDYFKVPLKRLEHQCKIQILPDGNHWEQATMYHNEVLNCLLDIAVKFKENGGKIPEFIAESIKKMGYSNLAMKKPNHHQTMQGDSDSTDLRDIITRCAAILEDPYLKFGGYKEIDFESEWELDKISIENYANLESIKPSCSSIALRESGNFYLRDSFNEDGNYMWFNCGMLGSGHGHANLLHFDLTYKGQDFFIDLGRYTYVEGNPIRVELKDCYSHNTTIVDNQLFTKFRGSWEMIKIAYPTNTYHKFEKDYDYVEGGHLGYFMQENPVLTFRKIIYLKPELWVIIDEFKTEGKHNYTQFFNLDNEIQCVKEGDIVVLEGKNKLNMAWGETPKIEIKDVNMSKEYNDLLKTKRIETNIEAEKNTSLFTIISPKKFEIEKVEIKRGDYTVVPDEEMKAIKLKLKNGEEFIFFNAMKEIELEIKTYLIEGILFYGKTGFIKKNGQDKELTVIRY